MHCGSRAGRARANELNLDECFILVDELHELGCKDVTLIGGEVFLFNGWEKVAQRFADLGILVNVVTNGYRIRMTEIKQITKVQLVNVGISIDGMEATHNTIRGRADAFAQVKRTLNLFKQAGITTGAVTTLMQSNFPDLEELYHFLVEHRVQVWQLQLVSAMGRMAAKNNCAIKPRQVGWITDFIREKNKERQIMVIAADSIGYFNDNEAYIRGNSSPICCWDGCRAGISSVFIDSVGNVKGCGALYSDEFIEGNVRQAPLRNIWNSSSSFSYNRRFTPDLLSGKCKRCDFGAACKGGCRSSNYFGSHSLYASTCCCR